MWWLRANDPSNVISAVNLLDSLMQVTVSWPPPHLSLGPVAKTHTLAKGPAIYFWHLCLKDCQVAGTVTFYLFIY